MLYDEQPCTWHQSWIQRLRWSKGFYQVFGKYSKDLVKGIFKGKSFACYDMLMTIAPALFVTLTSIVVNLFFLIFGLFVPSMTATMIPTTITAVCMSFLNFYLMLLAFGILTTVTEWKNINSTTAKKIKYIFTFPLFIFTYVPISIAALFQKVEWKPITHSIAASIEECTVTGKR